MTAPVHRLTPPVGVADAVRPQAAGGAWVVLVGRLDLGDVWGRTP